MVGERQIVSRLSMEDTIGNDGFIDISVGLFSNNGFYKWKF